MGDLLTVHVYMKTDPPFCGHPHVLELVEKTKKNKHLKTGKILKR